MNRTLYSLFLGAALVCQSGFAQHLKASASIPFSFKVGDSTMPAGDYSISQSGDVVRVGGKSGSPSLLHITMPASRRKATDDGKLLFTRYQDGYYLTTIWEAGSKEGRTVVPSKHQRELSKQSKSIEIAEVSFPSPLR